MSSLATDRVDQCSSGEFAAQPFALSPAQSALWYAQRIRPDIPLTIAQYVEIHGDLDAGRLLYAIERFGAETEVGHVRLLEIEGVPHQVVDPTWRPGWARIDLREEPDPRAAALAWMNDHASSPIDIEHDPLTINVVLRTGDSAYIWYTRGHHIVIDGYGAMNATTRTAEIYTALEAHDEPVVSRATPLAAIYADEGRYRETTRCLSDGEYWREQLEGVNEPLTLSNVSLAEAGPDAGRRCATAVLSAEVEAAVQEAATAFGSNPSVLFVAALACYVRAVIGTQDVVLSLPVSARTTVALRRSAGVVSNVVPIRVRFEGAATVADSVRAVELQITGALRHQRYRSDDIRRDCGYSRDARGFFGPMVNVMLFHSELRFGSLVGSLNVVSTGPVEDLSINLYNGDGNRIHIDFEANPRLYSDAELSMHHGRFLDFLERFLRADPQTVVGDMPVLTDLEREHVLHEWNSTQVARQEGTLAGLFADRAAMCPSRTALDFEGETLTYAAFDERANRLARELIARGAGPDTVVGLAIRRSLELLIGMYAIVKAGAAYLPLDPDHPVERLEQILEQANPLCVLTASRDALELPSSARGFDIDTADLSAHGGRPVTDADRRAALCADHLAYVLFTSGSTGKPKGVGVSHAAIVNRLRWMQHAYPLDGSDVVLQKTPATFDVSVWEFFWPLQIGARLLIAAPDGHRDPAYLARTIAEKDVTAAHFVPSMLSVFLTDTDVAGCTGLTRVFCSGEALPAATVAEFHTALGTGPRAPQLHNLYGPTEAAVDVTAWHCTPGVTEVPIGAPIWNTRTYVLDARLQPVAPGVVGELYLAGVQLARGYLGRPGLSADRFVANPFTPGTRMYRTGDLVRWRGGRTGVLEYLGRSDFQVKIRGLRIELGEIEAALLSDQRVARAVCVARRGHGGDELAAYVVATPGTDPLDPAELTAGLHRVLPGYMVPPVLMVLDELPLSANGKVDRKALPDPGTDPRRTPRSSAEPSTPAEHQLTAIFAEVLGTDEIGVGDNFFDLGGNSLSAARAITRANTALSAALTIRDLFEFSTVTALAARVESLQAETTSPKLAVAQRPAHIPLSLAQQRLWILNRFAEHAAAYNMPLAVELTGSLDVPALRAGLLDVLERHESLRTTFPDTPEGPGQVIHRAAEIPLTLEPIDVGSADIRTLIGEFASYGFDLRSQAPVRVALYEIAPDRHVFLMVLHHISGDGWSIAPLTRDIMGAVAARTAGTAPDWTPLPVQYADFALWQRELLGDEGDPASALALQLAYWRAALADLPDQLDLPLDRPRPRQRSTDGGRVEFAIPVETRHQLAVVAAERGVSTFMVLHAALAAVLARLCNTTDIAIGTPIAGRSDPALDELVGMFVNTLVLRTRVDPAAGFDRMLAEVRDTDLNAFANADVPFERLVEVVNPERSAARHPLFQVMLSYDSTPELNFGLPGVTAEVLPIAVDIAKFDLQLTVHEPLGATADGVSSQEMPLTAEFGYAADVFDHSTVEAIARRFGAVLAAAVADPAIPVGDLPILDARETAKLVPIMGAPGEPGSTLARLLTDTAERIPDAVAVRYLAQNTTYRELDERSNRLARVLIEHGAGPEVVVAVALPRSLDCVLAVWSVAKTGAAYVPIDPDYPADRIAHMLADSGAMLGLTSPDRRAEMPNWPGNRGRHRKSYVDWLLLGSPELADECARFADTPLTDVDRHHPLRTAGPAYLIYTSGTTGKPKAVVVTNAGIASLANEQTQLFRVTDSARTLHFSSPSFDASVLELLLGFAAGATLVVAPAGIYGGAELAELLRAERVTHAFVTPAALGTVPSDNLPDLEAVIVGGEACPEDLVRVWTDPRSREPLPPRRMHNMYGPSEATVAATATGPMIAGRPVPIGLPVRGMRLFVLDGRLHPVPPGVAGELYLSGPGLARGYLGRHGLTAQAFPANPHGRRGERMYRTGDLVVSDGIGQLRFLGRADDQIKIRGFRIELREIDHVLLAHEGITFALTVVHNDERGIPRLVSYLTADTEIDTATVLDTARGHLPGYMVPSALTLLENLPVTPSGKLDRKALPAPDFTAAAPSRAPETELEQRVAQVFGMVLGARIQGADDNFFEIGGNSLLATRLTAALHAEFGVELPVRDIFEAPTVAGVAARLQEAPRTQRAALAVRTPRPERIPLSLPQQRLWFLNRYSPESGAYNIAFVLRIDGDPDMPALGAALADLMQRHEVLRTVFPEDAHGAHQKLLDTARCLPVLDAIETDEVGARTALRSLARRGFDLTRDIPLRMTLLRTGNRRHLLGIAMHHIAADGWSLGPLTRDLAIAYAARHGGVAPTWTPLPVQYSDFSLWQRECLGQESDPESAAASQLAYWRAALADLPEEMPLPYDRPRPAEPTQRSGVVRFEVPEALQRRLAETARGNAVSMFMVLRSSLAVLLRVVTGGRDIVIGTPVAGRTDTRLDELVGMFVNTLVLRSDVDPDRSFAELLQADRDTELGAIANAEVPFERVIEELGSAAGGMRPVLQVALTVQDTPLPALQLPGLALQAEELDIALAKFDLELRVLPGNQSEGDTAAEDRVYEFVYAAELFDQQTVQILADRLIHVFEAVTADPRIRVSAIDARTEAERELFTPAWGPAPEPQCSLAAYFAATAHLNADREFLRFGDNALTYLESDVYSNRLARALIQQGIGPGDRVALGLTRSAESVLSALAVAKTGAAFVPVDPNYPADRLRHMLTDSGCRVGIAMTDNADRLNAAAGDDAMEWMLLDDAELLDELEVLDDGPITDADRTGTLWTAELAYIVYTSGSTGKPKGVAVTHGGLSNFADELRDRMRVDRDSRTMHFSSPSFDAAILDLLMAIGSGATMVIVPADIYGGDELAALMEAEEISHTFITPAALATIDRDRWALPHLHSVMVGGEACGPELVARWAHGRAMFNVYGPTETTVVVTISKPMVLGEPITIGSLVRGARALVLDERLCPVPVGVPGELYIGGQGAARGYVDRYDLTAARFIADPYGPEGARMYRTGDVVRWTPDGEIAYLGRSDHQVKVRGFRIELGEIDAVLTAHAGIHFAHTEVRDIAGTKRIVSFVLPVDPHAVDFDALRAHCAEHLPAHMVPSSLTPLDRIPLTPVGKLDRDALPQPQVGVVVVSRDPQTQTERLVAEVMAELVGAGHLGADDSFFEVGGNSLLATQLVARLAAATGVRLEVRSVFAAPTVAGLAAQLDSGPAASDARLEPRRRTRPEQIPLSAAQRRLWFLEQFNASGDQGEALGAYNIPVVLRLHGELNVQALRAALHAVQRRHETLRTIFPEIGGEPCQHVLEPAGAAVPLPLRAVKPQEVPDEIRRVTAAGFDLGTQVPLRATLLRLTGAAGGDRAEPSEHVLVLVVHHIAMDGWSLQPLAADVATAYRAYSGGGEPDWTELPIQYADYTLWQQDVLGVEDDPESVISRQLDYWRQALDGRPELLAVPADRPRPPVPSYRGGTVECTLDAFTHRELQALAAEHGVTMFMVLHAALVALLHRLTAGDDITVGTPIAGRGHPALDRMVGMFVGTLVLRTHLDGNAAFGDLLRAVRDTDLEAFAHADVPFERLVEVLNPARTQAHHPLFQVMLSVQNQPVRVLELPGLRIENDDADPGIAKFDLQFTLTESWTPGREPDGITVSVNYAADLFDDITAQRLADRFVRMLGAAAANPATAVGDLELLDSGEWAALAPVCGAEPARPITFPEVFEAAANLNRQAIAVRAAGTQISYDALDRWTNRLARVLIGYGVGPETLVAMGIPRSAESVAVTLAIAKAGAAFVPVDPNYPEQRISHMLLDSGAGVGITLAAHRERMPDGVNWTVLDAPSFRRRVLAGSDAPITDAERTTPLRMDNPAYVIYTSGSTGVPKGVVVTHGGLSNFAAETAQRFAVGPGARVLHFATPSFDAAMLDLLFALGGAATLVISPPGVVGGSDLGRVFIDEGITHAFITTSALGTVDPTGVTALRHVLVGGEALPPDLVTRWAPRRKLYNVYGPTETTIVTVISQPMNPGGHITIGGPIRGVGATVLDSRLHPVPVGVTGELQLAGAAVARGYLRRPGLTAQRFVANPFGKPGARMYRTGDLVRWVEKDGRARDLEYVGRTDHQVKIRGFRIELGEIDAALARHTEVEFATTIGHRTPAGSTALVSYVKSRTGTAPSIDELTSHVAELVPNYMVPQSIMLLDRVPLSPVGKLDRTALPEPVFAAREGYRAPSTPTEVALCAAFADVLGVEQVGVDDGFFELGGNSLLATKVVAQLRGNGVDLPVQAMFGESTPAAIARRLADADGDAGAALAAALQPVLPLRPITENSAAPLFCVHPAIGLSWCFAGLLAQLPADRPVYGLQAPHVTGGTDHGTIAEAAKYYVAHMKSVQAHGPYHLLGWSLGGLLAHEIAVQLQEQGDDVGLLALMDSYQLSDQLLEEAVPTVADIIGEFGSDMLGGDTDVDPRMSLQEAAEFLRSRPGPFAALTVDHLERLYNGYANGAVLAHSFEPRVFVGDLLFFTAADDEINRADPDRNAAAWEAHVTGAVHDQLVRCRHSGMTTPESLAVIGPVLREYLAANANRTEREGSR
ncbi:amino acid adenylation domain-containing protein [Nocardia sp. SYP-A9097]|uniref:non-ribosomal peptide synthetase n=1 Tax=Nocardia sp. SYP-A9097 TaxID=2663237 RepID=UPI00129B3BE8|nr:non-ribosomal peptide synthetase [Nocardia sp. SYP-A9097]MRH90134.1 amino acid adenylation domain-containing protein [Nocardia sp. SYP-A9097]